MLTIFAQYLAAVFILNPSKTYIEILSSPKLHLMTFASAFIIAGGYIINNFYDLEKDLINRPEKTLFGRIVSRKFCLNCYFLFNTIGLALAFSASWRIFLFYFLFAISLWTYSHKFQKIPFIREITASLLSVTSFFSIGIFYKYITMPLFIYGCFAMLIIFSREILKGIEAYKGNSIFGYGTMATWLGKQKSALGILIINIISLLPLIILLHWHNLFILSGTLLLLTLILNGLVYFKLYKNQSERNAEIVHNFYKIFLVVIICMVVLIPAYQS
ncbi:MAG: geranylgeranylglycerol-phosphate geranylgeranyltransferase [Bacteroidia bacterium]